MFDFIYIIFTYYNNSAASNICYNVFNYKLLCTTFSMLFITNISKSIAEKKYSIDIGSVMILLMYNT